MPIVASAWVLSLKLIVSVTALLTLKLRAEEIARGDQRANLAFIHRQRPRCFSR